MKTRIIFAAVGIPVLLLILLAAPSWVTLAMCAALAAVASYELMHAVGDEEWELLPAMPVLAAAMTGALGVRQLDIPVIWILAGIFAVVLYGFLTAIFTHGKEKQLGFATLAAGILSATLLPAGFASLALLRDASAALALAPLVGAFMSDTGAYFMGRALGRHKLCPHVSPNKTVEGCVGGFIGSVAGMIVYHLIVKATVTLDLGWALIIVLGLVGSLFGQIGDLSFSVIKREYGIKDYGAIFPGHGGVLDRFDSVLFVSPAYYLIITAVMA